MEGIAGEIRELAHRIRSYESLEQERRIGQGFAALQEGNVIRINVEIVCLDSASVKVHPDGTGALKTWEAGHWKIPRRPYHEDSYGYRI